MHNFLCRSSRLRYTYTRPRSLLCSIWIFNLRVPSGVGLATIGLFFLATLAYGIVVGDRVRLARSALTSPDKASPK